jgi:hypothetical protein
VRTDELVVQLARSARPIRPLPRPGVRAMRSFAAALLVMLAAIVLTGPRADLTWALRQPVFLGSLVALLLTLASGTAAAFVLSVPGAGRSRLQRFLPLLTAGGWSAIWLVVVLTADESAAPATAPFHWACAIQIAVGAVATGWLLFVMIARAAPLQPVWTAAVASLASMATGAAVAQVLCPVDDPMHQLIGHVLIALVLASAGLLVGHRSLKFSPVATNAPPKVR